MERCDCQTYITMGIIAVGTIFVLDFENSRFALQNSLLSRKNPKGQLSEEASLATMSKVCILQLSVRYEYVHQDNVNNVFQGASSPQNHKTNLLHS